VVRTAAEAGLIKSEIHRLAGIAAGPSTVSSAPGEAASRDRRACAGFRRGISGVSQPPGIRQSAWSERRIGDLNPGGCYHPTALAVPLYPYRSGRLRAAKARNRRPPVPGISAIFYAW
jgi:hypothetical protein